MFIEVKGASKSIRHERILNDISFSIRDGEVIGLQGVNGSGKTMIMRMICGLIYPTTGEIVFDGEHLGREIDFPSSVGLLLEAPAFVEYESGAANLELLASIKGVAGRSDIEHSMLRVGLDPALKRPYGKYSLGMKQRLGIAATLVERPDLIVLDEPTNALDESGVEVLKKIIREEKERGAGLLISSHDSTFLHSVCDAVHTVSGGKLKRGDGYAGEE